MFLKSPFDLPGPNLPTIRDQGYKVSADILLLHSPNQEHYFATVGKVEFCQIIIALHMEFPDFKGNFRDSVLTALEKRHI